MAQPKPQRASYEDCCKVDPKHYRVEFENERVRVVRCNYGPHERSVMHGHPDNVAVFLTDARVRFTYPDGRTEEASVRAGQTQDTASVVHLPENIGDRPMEVLLIELKGQ
jgi:quercetin dioxygenase-like cupin family protein